MRRPLLFLCVCVVAVIYLYMYFLNPPPWDNPFMSMDGDTIVITGQVYQKESRIQYDSGQIIFFLQNISLDGQSSDQYSQYKIRCELQQNTEIPLGSIITVKGTFHVHSSATNPGEFDAATYYGVNNICGRVSDPQVTTVEEKHWLIREELFQLRALFTERIITAFGEETGGILAKMLLGDGSFLDQEVKKLYQENGIIHVLSISGLHISMLGMGMYKLLRKCRVGICGAAISGGIFILLYGTMIGFGLSATRAIGMYLIHMIGIIWGKGYDMLTSMGIILFLMVLENPRVLFHSGFLLSFGSVCALGLLLPKLQEYIRGFSSLLVSISVTVFTLPIQLSFFYKMPLYSVFLNLLILPFLSIVMIVGILVMVFPFLAPISLVGVWILNGYEWLCLIFEKLPWHSFVVGHPESWKIVIYYVVLMIFVCYKPVRNRKWVLMIPVFLVLFLCIPSRPELRVVMLDVGQGDSILIQTEDGFNILVDGGSSSKSNVGQYQISPALLYYGVDYIDAVIITHPDSDHMNGLKGLLENGYEDRIGQILLPAIDVERRGDEFGEIYELAAAYHIRVRHMAAGDELVLGDARMECLHPARETNLTESNAYSLVYYLTYSQFSMLLTGDVEAEGEEQFLGELVRCGIRDVTVLKVAHHGSRYSTSEELLGQINPKVALISCGENNSYGHPHVETIERLREEGVMILTTPEYGAITIEVGKKIEVSGWIKPAE